MSSIAKMEANLEDLCCILCEDYLSCGPIRLMANGCTICGRCIPNQPTYRDFTLEALLSQVSFPCCFRQLGCARMVPFDEVVQHESTCRYKNFPCPSSQADPCSWNGSTIQLHNHFATTHADLVTDNPEFKLKLGEDSSGVLMTVHGSKAFIVKYVFDGLTLKLGYDIRVCAVEDNHSASCKIELTNDSAKDCNVGLKAHGCALYDGEFSKPKNLRILHLIKFADELGDLSCIRVLLKLRVVENVEIFH